MGKTEEIGRKHRGGNIERAILGAIAITGVLSVAVVAPNALRLLKYVPKNKYRFTSYSRRSLNRLVQKGYISFIQRGEQKFAQLTALGERQVELEKIKVIASVQMKKWDKRWRMVLFDIPERRRGVRNRLRFLMIEAGFLRLQNSAWIYPYDCEDLIDLVKAELRIGTDVVYAIIERFQDERGIRKHFGLPEE